MNGRYIHRLQDIYSPYVNSGLPDGRYVAAVAEPYTAGSLWAAWAVLTGRAVAFQWPKAGDLEDIFQPTKANSSRLQQQAMMSGAGMVQQAKAK